MAGVCRAACRVLGQQFQGEVVEVWGNIRTDRPWDRWRRIEMLEHDRKRLAFCEGRLAGQQRI